MLYIIYFQIFNYNLKFFASLYSYLFMHIIQFGSCSFFVSVDQSLLVALMNIIIMLLEKMCSVKQVKFSFRFTDYMAVASLL